MKKMLARFGILIILVPAIMAQSGPFTSSAAVMVNIQPASPVAGGDFTVDIFVNLERVSNTSTRPASLGGYVLPIAFDNTRVALKAVINGSTSVFASGFTHTEITQANIRGYATLVNAHAESGAPAGNFHVATLTFNARQGGRVLFAVNSSRAGHEGSLSSTFDPAGGGGPSLIAYTDEVTEVQLNSGSKTYHLLYPSFISSGSGFQGVAILNESEVAASLSLRAYGVDGNLLALKGMTNPTTLPALPARTQFVKLVEEIFGMSRDHGTDHGWIDVESSSPNTSGFFLMGNTQNGITTELDGVDVSHMLTGHAIFPVLFKDSAKNTSIYAINPDAAPAAGSLRLFKNDGAILETASVLIPPRGVFERDFPSTALPADGYIELEMSAGMVTGFEKFGTARSLACLAVQDADRAANTLYAPHLASGRSGAQYFTEINVINPKEKAANATFRLFDDQGAEGTASVTRKIEAKSQLRVWADQLFGLPAAATSDQYSTGFIKIECDQGLVGSVTFGDTRGNFLTSLPLLSTSSAKREIYLDHVALGTLGPTTYWTGIALVNASQERPARITVELYGTNSQLVGKTTNIIPRKGRLMSLISELDPVFNVNQFGGFIRVISDIEVFAFMLFGDTQNTFLSAVPVR